MTLNNAALGIELRPERWPCLIAAWLLAPLSHPIAWPRKLASARAILAKMALNSTAWTFLIALICAVSTTTSSASPWPFVVDHNRDSGHGRSYSCGIMAQTLHYQQWPVPFINSCGLCLSVCGIIFWAEATFLACGKRHAACGRRS